MENELDNHICKVLAEIESALAECEPPLNCGGPPDDAAELDDWRRAALERTFAGVRELRAVYRAASAAGPPSPDSSRTRAVMTVRHLTP